MRPNKADSEEIDGTQIQHSLAKYLPSTIFGRFKFLCSYLKVVICAMLMVLDPTPLDYVIVDQVSLAVPFLRLKKGTHVVYYCNEPQIL